MNLYSVIYLVESVGGVHPEVQDYAVAKDEDGARECFSDHTIIEVELWKEDVSINPNFY